MTKQEIAQRFHVPERVLEEYEKNIRSNSMEPYTDNDLALLSQIVTLYEIGFSSGQVQEYLKTLSWEAFSTGLACSLWLLPGAVSVRYGPVRLKKRPSP